MGMYIVQSFGRRETLLLAYQTLGIVYGDLGTSPLYVFSSIGLENPQEKDILGCLSLIFWTLTMIAMVKYVMIVLRANDHGEGNGFYFKYFPLHLGLLRLKNAWIAGIFLLLKKTRCLILPPWILRVGCTLHMHISTDQFKPEFVKHLEVVKFEVAYTAIGDTNAILNFTMVMKFSLLIAICLNSRYATSCFTTFERCI